MTTTLATAAPRFHALTGTQPVGRTQIATMAEYAGSVTALTRKNDTYWVVTTRDVRGAFVARFRHNASVAIWMDTATMEFVVDYWDNSVCVEADRTRTLRAAIGVACDVTARHWATAQ